METQTPAADSAASPAALSQMSDQALTSTSPMHPVCVIVLGMAGSGKTSLVTRLTSYLHAKKLPPYVVNLDPACAEVPYPTNIGKQFVILTV